jgi:hypothetical protein
MKKQLTKKGDLKMLHWINYRIEESKQKTDDYGDRFDSLADRLMEKLDDSNLTWGLDKPVTALYSS